MNAEVDIQQLAIVRDEPAAKPTGRRRHVLSRYVVPGVLLVGFLALVAWASRDTLRPPRSVWVVPVMATQSAVQREGTPLFQAAGWIQPRPTPVRVAALAPGVVEELLVVEDQVVKAGEPVAQLVTDDARLAHDSAAANLKLRGAELRETQAAVEATQTRFEQPVHLEAALGEADAALAAIDTELKNLPYALRRAEAELEFAESDYEGKLASEGAVAGRVIHEAKSALDAARALVEELRNRADSLETQYQALVRRYNALGTQLKLLADETQAKDEAVAKLQAAEARVDQARVALAEAKLRLHRMTVRAPIDGRVYQLVAYPGTTLTGGMGPAGGDGSTVVTLYRPDMLQVRVDVRFEDIPKVSLGQPVRVNNPALAQPLAGTVLFVSSEANIQKNTLEVKVVLDEPAPVFRPDMLVDATFLAPEVAESLAETVEETRIYVPQQVVQRDETGTFVWLADHAKGVARRAAVTTGGIGGAGMVEITGGLTIASRVIARGHDGLADGARIRVAGEEAQLISSTSPPTDRQPSMGRFTTPTGGN